MFGRFVRRLLLLLIVIVAFVSAIAYWQYQDTLSTPLDLNGLNDGQLIVSVSRGDTIRSISHDLKSRGLLANEWPVIAYTRLNNIASAIQAGDYRIEPYVTTPVELIDKMVNGEVIVNTITVVEGRTFAQMMEKIHAHPFIEHTLLDDNADDIAHKLNIKGSPEGWFLPDTYQFPMGTSDIELLQRMHETMQTTLNDAWANRADNLPLNSPYEALILASIVEKETGIASERAQVAGVFIRRLSQNMRLQTDPTVIYGAKNYQGTLTKADLKTDTPYNTYTRHGLPPTPIALPSRASIEAALHPDDGSSLYFVADGQGGHVFSDTYQAHLEAVAAYRQAQRANK